MRKGSGFKGGSKSVTKRSGASSRSSSRSRPGSSWGGTSRRSWSNPRASGSNARASGGGGWSWLAAGGPREGSGPEGGSTDPSPGAWWDGAGPSDLAGGGLGEGLGRALGEGLAGGISDGIGELPGAGDGAAAFWRGVAVCALVVAGVVLVLYLIG